MSKTKKKIRLNQGNSFIVVIATVSFLAILVTALLVAVALCYRMKAYDINSRDNFYYLEKAMDEIYEGVGNITMQHLNDAYNETLEVLVTFDPAKESYVTMSDEEANTQMKQSFINKLKVEQDSGVFSSGQLQSTLESFITNNEDAGGHKDVEVTVVDTAANMGSDGNSLVIKNIILSRHAEYSTLNTHDVTEASEGTSTFTQTITTDLVISAPEYDVDFTNVGKDVNNLYEFVMISDMGVEVTGIGTKSNISGNIYAAADFYNKDYETEVNSYNEAQLNQCDGVTEKSMYSGFYVSGADVSIVADKMIVPGTIASMNCGKITITGNVIKNASKYANTFVETWYNTDEIGYDEKAGYTQVWADGIVLGGYSRKSSATDDSSYTGSVINMKADTYVYDDLEVNSTGSQFSLDGTYYGYNYAQTDNRSYSDAFIAASSVQQQSSIRNILDGVFVDQEGDTTGHLVGQAHYNSSSIVVNGSDTLLDLGKTKSIYIAGQAYVELSKTVEKTEYEVDDNLTLQEAYSYDTYNEYDPEEADKNYTTTNIEDGQTQKTYTSIQDYRTGEALSIKSNQLAYIPPYAIKRTENGNVYVAWPAILKDVEYFNDIWDDLSKVPIVVTNVSGKENYFYDFSKAKTDVNMNEYLEAYAQLFNEENQDALSRTYGEMSDFYDITDTELLKVDNIIIDADEDGNVVNDVDNITNKIYTNSAISFKKGDKINIIADSDALNVLQTASKALDKMNTPLETDDEGTTDDEETTDANAIVLSNMAFDLQNEYKEMKLLLTNTSQNPDDVSKARDDAESTITPINQYFDFAQLPNGNEVLTMESGYKVFMSNGDFEVEDGNLEEIKGIVVCKGDVTFGPNVKSFEGIIVSGGKIKVNQSMNFVANAEVVKSILRECYDKNDSEKLVDRTDQYAKVCLLFKPFLEEYGIATGNAAENVESMKRVEAVVYEDMLSFENWKKNVD